MDTMWSVANVFRWEGKFCDAVIKVKKVGFHVHKVVMCVCDPFFSELFLSSPDPDCRDFSIEGVSHEIMSEIIDFAYTGSVTMTNIFELMAAANQLNLTSLQQTCSNIVKDQLSEENCIKVWQFTNTNHFPELQHKAFDFICGHFEAVALCGGFMQLAVQELTAILGRDDLNVFPESRVYESVLRWTNHRPEERHGTLATLLSKVRLGMLDINYIRDNVCSNDLVMENRELKLIVSQIIRYQTKNNNCLFRPRVPNAIVLAFGGRTNDKGSVVEAYNYWTNSWNRVPNCKNVPAVRNHGTVFLKGSVYIVGGWLINKISPSKKMYRFNTETHTWKKMCSMYQQRWFVSATVLNGCIYAIGGRNSHSNFRTAEYFHPDTNQWTFIAPMNECRNTAGCATLNNKIYICGGHNGTRYLKTAEFYNPDTDQWTLINPMGICRAGLGIIAYMGHIFAVGGNKSNRCLKSAEAYNPVTNKWHNVPSMVRRRCCFGIAVINKRVLVVGEDAKVEFYDSTTASWSEACSMEIPRRGLSCCVISGLSNMAEYCDPIRQ